MDEVFTLEFATILLLFGLIQHSFHPPRSRSLPPSFRAVVGGVALSPPTIHPSKIASLPPCPRFPFSSRCGWCLMDVWWGWGWIGRLVSHPYSRRRPSWTRYGRGDLDRGVRKPFVEDRPHNFASAAAVCEEACRRHGHARRPSSRNIRRMGKRSFQDRQA